MRSSDMICLDIAQMLGLDDEVISNVEKRCAEIDFGAISSSQNKLFDPRCGRRDCRSCGTTAATTLWA